MNGHQIEFRSMDIDESRYSIRDVPATVRSIAMRRLPMLVVVSGEAERLGCVGFDTLAEAQPRRLRWENH